MSFTLAAMPTTVFLVRHAETYGNIEGRFCGHSETELTPKGIEQARALGLRLKGAEIRRGLLIGPFSSASHGHPRA